MPRQHQSIPYFAIMLRVRGSSFLPTMKLEYTPDHVLRASSGIYSCLHSTPTVQERITSQLNYDTMLLWRIFIDSHGTSSSIRARLTHYSQHRYSRTLSARLIFHLFETRLRICSEKNIHQNYTESTFPFTIKKGTLSFINFVDLLKNIKTVKYKI